MASLLQASAALARRASSSQGVLPRALAVASRSQQLLLVPGRNNAAAGISTTRVLDKRRGGNSAFVVKAGKFRGHKPSTKTKDKLKADTAPHKTHVDSIRQLKALGKDNDRNAQAWDQLENDAELNAELDNVFQYLKNLGPDGDYVYKADPTLADLDENDVLRKLNALARRDPAVLAEVSERLLEEQHEERSALDNTQQQHELSVDDYNFLMRVYAEKGQFEKANALLARMEQNLAVAENVIITPSLSPATATTDALVANDAEADLALDTVPHTIAPDAKSYMYYVISLVNAGAAGPAAAVRTLGRMKERGVLPDVHLYNSVMNVCAKAKKVQWAYNMMEKMQLAGHMPDRASFTILMHAAIAEGEIDKAFETFHLMRSRVTEPDVVAFSVLIHGYAKIGRIERAINLYEDLLDSGLTPTHFTFNALILACAKSHYYAHKAVEFYHEMQELYDYHPDPFTYMNVLHACAKHGDFLQAEEILRHMRVHHVPIDERTYNTLLNVYARAQIKTVVAQAPRNKKPAAPLEPIHQEPLEFDDDGRQIDMTRPFKDVSSPKNWNYDGTFDEEDEDEDEHEYEEYDQDNHDSDDVRDGAMTEEERAQLQQMRQQDALTLREPVGPVLDDMSATPMDLAHFGNFQTQNIARAEQLYAEMTQQQQLPVSVVTLTTMLSVYANALRIQRAEQFADHEFAKHGIAKNVFTYRTLMQMYVRAHRTPKAEALLQEMQQQIQDGELPADRIAMGLLVDHYARHKYLRKALVLLEHCDELHVQLEERHYKKIRQLTEKYGLFTELIPEDPNAVITAGTRSKLMEKRKVRAQTIAFNQKVGKKFLLPASVKE